MKQPPPHTGLRVMYAPGPVGYADDLLGVFFLLDAADPQASWGSFHTSCLGIELAGYMICLKLFEVILPSAVPLLASAKHSVHSESQSLCQNAKG